MCVHKLYLTEWKWWKWAKKWLVVCEFEIICVKFSTKIQNMLYFCNIKIRYACNYKNSKSTQLGWKFEQKIQENFEKNFEKIKKCDENQNKKSSAEPWKRYIPDINLSYRGQEKLPARVFLGQVVSSWLSASSWGISFGDSESEIWFTCAIRSPTSKERIRCRANIAYLWLEQISYSDDLLLHISPEHHCDRFYCLFDMDKQIEEPWFLSGDPIF